MPSLRQKVQTHSRNERSSISPSFIAQITCVIVNQESALTSAIREQAPISCVLGIAQNVDSLPLVIS